MSVRRDVILVADDDDDILRFVEVNLRLEGFEVVTVSDGEAALRSAYEVHPDLVLLDVMMPNLDGFEVCQRLRNDHRTKDISVIMLTAKSLSADKVVGLTAGADDYMIKPFDPLELVARVRSALRRSRELRAVSPLTLLPGNVQIREEVANRVENSIPFAVLYIDLNDFKSYNDHYGFARGDEVIKLLARCANAAIKEESGSEAFLGHIGGDDLVAVIDPAEAEGAAQRLINCWDADIPKLYDEPDAERGYIEIADRRKEVHRFPLMTVAIGIATTAKRAITSYWEACEIASEMKAFAKTKGESTYALDRRTSDERSPT